MKAKFCKTCEADYITFASQDGVKESNSFIEGNVPGDDESSYHFGKVKWEFGCCYLNGFWQPSESFCSII